MDAVVGTSNGKLQGATEGGVLAFRGIPYAQPPTGALRFRAPRPPLNWEGVRDATHFSAIAPQLRQPSALMPADDGPMSEDCLYLNVWTPGLDAARRPVMVWIHGGAFATGTGSSAWSRGAGLAARGDVVVVTINYRLGALGFLYEPALADQPGAATGNFGMLDQVAALEWVQREIAAFGGDPDNVTIFGESAGGMSVGALMGSPKASGRFNKAIPQSGAAHNAFTTEQAQATTTAFAEALDTTRLAPDELRSLSVERLLGAQQQAMMSTARNIRGLAMAWQPVIDGEFLTQLPIDAVRAGSTAHVPTLIGSTSDEWKLFTAILPGAAEIDEASAGRRIARLVSPDGGLPRAQQILATYREARAARGEPVDALSLFEATQTDFGFRVPADRLTEAQAAREARTYAYRFDWGSPALEGRLGACHAIEIAFVFGTLDVAPKFSGEGPDAETLSTRVQDAWLAFARTGNPTTPALPWPAFDAARRQTMLLDRECRADALPREAERRAWDGVVS